MLLNQVQLVGRVGTEVVLKTGKSGLNYVSLLLAVVTGRKREDNRDQDVNWHRVKIFAADAVMFHGIVKKGDKILIQGRLKNNSYTDKNGVLRIETEINANHFMLLSAKAKPVVEMKQEVA